MRNYFLIALVVAVVGLGGCGAKTTINTTPLSDEQKKQVAEDDKRIADEESNGTAGKVPPKKAGKR
ncbi:hypothetical protein J8F10_16150 [Gemmata sp. G18]|uniref:Lipoprotein n=1 Tax=Gemmata palustris TaxID=2822762 RepID=A0ABS5BSV7_9BACT|nr:hypothetical protein [Gemmata palustris]MBP3956806.1 hypothetical protein [Gemmata palustris]